MSPLISAQELHALRQLANSVVVLDATVRLPSENYDPQQRYRGAHLPGAGRFDIELFSDPDSSLPHMVPSQGRFARLIAELGIGNDSHVVFYDQAGLIGSARAWWLMGLFGHDRAQILAGGLKHWRAQGMDVEEGEPAGRAPVSFAPRLRADRLVGLGDMIAITAGERQAIVIDARSRARFEGKAPEPRPGLPGGHIPGSASLPFTDLLDADGSLLPPDALQARFAQAGIDGSLPVVTSCGSGLTASVLSLGLVVAGFAPGALFDGSWTEWASHPELARLEAPQLGSDA